MKPSWPTARVPSSTRSCSSTELCHAHTYVHKPCYTGVGRYASAERNVFGRMGVGSPKGETWVTRSADHSPEPRPVPTYR
jgi:hypothetical protein